MDTNDKFFYPITPEVLHRYADAIFAPVRRGESVTTVWVPMTGRRMWNKFIIENINLFEEELPNHDKYLLVYVEPLDLTEESITGYLRLMGKSFIEVGKKNEHAKDKIASIDTQIFDEPSAQYTKLLDSLRTLLSEATSSGLEVIFFLGEFDELNFASKMFHNNLKSVWSKLYPRLQYIFLMRTSVSDPRNISIWGELAEAVFQNIVYMPIHKDVVVDYLLDYFSDQYQTQISDSEKALLKKLCGGHSYMLKVATRFISLNRGTWHSIHELEQMLYDHHELRSIAKAIYDTRSDREKEVLLKIAKGNPSAEKNDVLEFLADMGLVYKEENQYHIFAELVRDVILSMHKKANVSEEVQAELYYDAARSAIILDGTPIDEKFTHQEHMVLAQCLQKKGEIVTREDLGEVLWGKESYDKYSDWAIDQLMSKLRKKLETFGARTTITTLRGRGYKLAVPS